MKDMKPCHCRKELWWSHVDALRELWVNTISKALKSVKSPIRVVGFHAI